MTTATLTAGTYQGKTAEQWREQGRRDVEAERESFERCDTDGFMSQWAHQIGAYENELKAQLAERGAWTEVRALFDLDGNLIDALHGWGQYGEYFMILDADGNKDVTRGRNGFFSPSQARSETTARRNNAAKGFYVGTAKVPAVVDIRGGSITSVNAGIFPAEKTITAANIIEIVDNGHDTPEAEQASTEQEAQMPQTENTPQVGDTVTVITNGRRFDGGRVVRVSKTGAQVTYAKYDKILKRDGEPDTARRHSNGQYYWKNRGIVNPLSEVVFERPAPPNPEPLFSLDITEPDRAVGFMLVGYDPNDPADDWSIFGTRENGVWNVWTDSHGSATGHTLAAAAKRWARQHGLEHGTAKLGRDADGSEKIITW